MKQQNLFDPVPRHRLEMFSKEELIEFFEAQQKVIDQFQKHLQKLESLKQELEQKSFLIEEQYITIKNKLFGKSSERSVRRAEEAANRSKSKKKRVQLPSERYPHAPLIERHITLDKMPSCSCCGSEMQDTGMTQDSEYLTKIPAQYYVVVQMRHKYACRKCHGDVKTAPAPPRIKEGSSYSDEMAIDVSVSKYCDLIPIERQVQMARREGVKDLPPQSLIECTHNLADFVRPAYQRLQDEITKAKVLHADETPHRMLEGALRSGWYLWGFSTPRTSYFECHDTRSGDIASELLSKAHCEFLVSDVYSGYGKAVRETNKVRAAQNRSPLLSVYCNAHARRYFKQALERCPEESGFYIRQYRKIYRLEGLAQKHPDKRAKIRERLLKYFEKIRDKCIADVGGYSAKSALGKAMGYFLKNYEGLTRFVSNPELPIDNNPAERLLRSHVVGRKTWYGTHSQRGAQTAVVLLSLIESCKLNHINPRQYFKKLVHDLHLEKSAYTPKEFKDLAN